jgi:hypothetical protein
MPQITVNSPNISVFSFSTSFDIANRQVIFTDTSTYNNISGHGVLFVNGLSFSLVDQDGVVLTEINWTSPQIPYPATNNTFSLDLSNSAYAFLFQSYTIIGSIKDSNGVIYTTIPVIKKVCQPIGITDSGYVGGIFKVTPNIPANTLSVSEVTPFIYNNNRPISIIKNGNLYYPTGTISPVHFTGTPFANNVIYSGQYRIVNTSVGTYDLQDQVYVLISYYTDNIFNVFVGNKMADLNCCIMSLQETAIKRCNDAVGQSAKQKLSDISVFYMNGLIAEINGQDSSTQYEYIKKYLNCDCGSNSLKQNEISPINPTTNTIIVTGVNGSTVTPTTNGATTTYVVSSNIYSVVKGNTGDLAFTISTDNTVSGYTKTVITFNYNTMAGYILSAITSNPTLMDQLNSLISFQNANIDLTNLNGGCIVNIGSNDYFSSYQVPNNTAVFQSITINGTLHTAPSGLLVSGTDSINAFLNSLGLGELISVYTSNTQGNYFGIVSTDNSNVLNSIVLNIGGNPTIVNFQSTNKSIIAVLQAIIDFLCSLTALQIALGNSLSLGYFDYNGNIVFSTYLSTNTQNDFNTGIVNSIQNIINRINTLSSITCARIQSLFQDYPSAVFNITSDRFLSVVNGNCATLSAKQLATSIINSINAYSDVKSMFCAIDCTVPGACPDISGININIVAQGANIDLALYGVSFTNTPNSSQTVTIKTRYSYQTNFSVLANNVLILPNGNVSGISPYLMGQVNYNSTVFVQIINNCGGQGFIKQITTPASGIFTGSYSYGNILYLACGQTPVQLYSSSSFAIGTIMYTDAGLTIPLTGNTYIVNQTGEIFTMNTATGTILSDTGSNCGNGTANSVLLGNNSSTICSVGQENILYTNGSFAVGGTLFFDRSLTQPVHGTSYVVYNGVVFNLNTTTGQIGTSTGISCLSSTTLTINYTTGNISLSLPAGVTLPFDLTVSNMSIKGSGASNCSTPTETATLTSLTLPNTVNSIFESVAGITCSSINYYIVNSTTVNGNLLTNGGTVVIGGVTITVIIVNTTCSPYTC